MRGVAGAPRCRLRWLADTAAPSRWVRGPAPSPWPPSATGLSTRKLYWWPSVTAIVPRSPSASTCGQNSRRIYSVVQNGGNCFADTCQHYIPWSKRRAKYAVHTVLRPCLSHNIESSDVDVLIATGAGHQASRSAVQPSTAGAHTLLTSTHATAGAGLSASVRLPSSELYAARSTGADGAARERRGTVSISSAAAGGGGPMGYAGNCTSD